MPHNPRFVKIACLVLLVAAMPPPARPAPTKSLDGYWRTRGYGSVLAIQGKRLVIFEVTTKTCVMGFTARLQSADQSSREATFKSNEGDVFFFRAAGERDHKRVHFENTASDVRVDRLEAKPASCDSLTPNTSQGNFEVFTRTFAEHYISFDLKHADWDRIVATHRSAVTEETTPAQLFGILTEMVSPFGDAHIFIGAPKLKRQFEGVRPGTDRILKGQSEEKFEKTSMKTLLAAIDRVNLKAPPKKFCNGYVQYGHVDDATGYLRILQFGDYVKVGGEARELRSLNEALDKIFSDPALRALIIDARINFGGSDPLGLAVASRLTSVDYLAFSKQARADPTDRNEWTDSDPSIVRPTARPSFLGPVVELIGPYTISAGETFTQALMGRTPHITRIGENTQGVFSDIMGRHLPNGWLFGLPNEVFRTPAGTTFDGAGIPPDIMAPVFADSDIAAGRDPAIRLAMQLLGRR